VLGAVWLLGFVVPRQGPVASARLSLRLLELSLVADSSYGLQLLVEPKDGTTGHSLVWLRFDPDSALAWLNSAAAVLRTPVSGGPPDAIQWSSTLRPIGGRGGFLLGRHRKKGTLEKDHWLAIADSAPGWQAEIAAREADSLLHLILVLAPRAAIDTGPHAALDCDRVDQPAVPTHQTNGGGGSHFVAAQYVVGVDGRVEPESLRLLLAPTSRLEAAAREEIFSFRFQPAVKGGKPVRQLVQQVLSFK
jgi:hypothetical protein